VEHDFRGKVSEDPVMRTRMMDKRKRKTENLDMSPYLTVEGKPEAKLVLIGWGSTLGPLREARRQLEKEGIPILHLHIGALKPLPAETIRQYLIPGTRVVVAEHNQYGQLRTLLQPLSCEVSWESLLKYDGRSFDSIDVLNYLKGVAQHG
jgi:2-oxoglutarate ferredoxin oxidoreductase subunit alpha